MPSDKDQPSDASPVIRPAFGGTAPPEAHPVPWADGGRAQPRPWAPGEAPAPSDDGVAADAGPPASGGAAAQVAEGPGPEAAPEPEVVAPPELAPPPEPAAPPADPEPQVVDGPCPRCEATRAEAADALDALEDELREPMARAGLALERATAELGAHVTANVIELARRLALALVGREVAGDAELLRGTLEEALRVAGPIAAATLRCHPEDAEALRELAPGVASELSGRPVEVTVRPSDDVERGSCIVLFDEGIVDARWSAQIDRMIDAVTQAVASAAAEADASDPEAP